MIDNRMVERTKMMVRRYNAVHHEAQAQMVITEDGYRVTFINQHDRVTKWANDVVIQSLEDKSVIKCQPIPEERLVVVRTTHGVGTAICSEKDNFDAIIGTAIAYTRAIGATIPWFVK